MSIKTTGHSYVDVKHEEYFSPEVEIGNYTSIAEGTLFFGQSDHPCIKHREFVSTFNFGVQWQIPFTEKSTGKGKIIIGNDVWIGRDVTILSGVSIGDGVIIAAKSVISKDIPPYAMVAGNPATIKYYRFSKEQINKLLKIKWWEWADSVIRNRLEDFKNINIFLEKYYFE